MAPGKSKSFCGLERGSPRSRNRSEERKGGRPRGRPSPLPNGAGEVKVFLWIGKRKPAEQESLRRAVRGSREAMGGLQVSLVGRTSSFQFNVTFPAGSTLFWRPQTVELKDKI